jgi:ATP-dependent helicase/nuclease subunit A
LNLLYVAMTRARQALLISGSENRSNSSDEGWHSQILTALAPDVDQVEMGDSLYELNTDHPVLPTHTKRTLPVPNLALTDPIGKVRSGDPITEFGELVHAILERLAPPAIPPDREILYQTLGAPLRFDEAWERATHIVLSAELDRFFNPATYQRAHNELSYVRADGSLRRIDRVVEFEDEIWVLDYKTGDATDTARLVNAHRPQLVEYQQALTLLMPGKPVFAGLITATGTLLPCKFV